MQEILNRLHEIDAWIHENGFGLRGASNASPNLDAEKLESALTTLLNAHDTLTHWERFYMNLFIEKSLEEYPRIAKQHPELIRKYQGGWLTYSELERLYRICKDFK